MDAIEYNNRERLKEFSNSPSSQMTLREKIATDALVAIIGVIKPTNDNGFDECVERAISITDKFIKKLNENGR
jgi:hypothetical protein